MKLETLILTGFDLILLSRLQVSAFTTLGPISGNKNSFTTGSGSSGLTVDSKLVNGRKSITRVFSLTTDSKNRYERDDAVRMKQEAAKTALQNLLQRQLNDIEQTKNMLKRVEDDAELLPDENGDINASNASSITASIYSAANFGFTSRSQGKYEKSLNNTIFENYAPPPNIFRLGYQQFNRNLRAIKDAIYENEETLALSPKQRELQSKLKQLTLNSTAIWERERARGPIVAPLVIKLPYLVLCYLLDVVFEGVYVPSRFFLLETVARMPYFSYITMLHLYETVGIWRRSADVKRVHFAEEWNEFHHLLIMESLGGDQKFWVRFVAQHSAIVYFFVLVFLWALSPSLSYKFSELLESHAVDTYGQFLDENEGQLRDLPPSLAAVEYYSLGVSDTMFGEYQTSRSAEEIRKPGFSMSSLYDVFSAILNDEGDHVGTMRGCLDPKVAVMSPSLETKALTAAALVTSVGYLLGAGDLVNDGVLFDTIQDVGDIQELEGATSGLKPLIEGFLAGVATIIQGSQNEETSLIESQLERTDLSILAESVRDGLISFLELVGFL